MHSSVRNSGPCCKHSIMKSISSILYVQYSLGNFIPSIRVFCIPLGTTLLPCGQYSLGKSISSIPGVQKETFLVFIVVSLGNSINFSSCPYSQHFLGSSMSSTCECVFSIPLGKNISGILCLQYANGSRIF